MSENPATKEVSKVTFIPAGELPTLEKETLDFEVLTRTNWEDTIQSLADNVGHQVAVSRKPDVKRKQVVNAFLDTFSLIGGVPRLAIWADENPAEFYRMWSKLAPRQVEQETKHDGGLRIEHALPRGRLDE